MGTSLCTEHEPDEIIESALVVLREGTPKHYEVYGIQSTRLCLRALYDATVRCLEERSTRPMISHAQSVARKRYSSGFDLHEVLIAFSALEEAIWAYGLENLEPPEFLETMGLVSTILGAGKDALAMGYASLKRE